MMTFLTDDKIDTQILKTLSAAQTSENRQIDEQIKITTKKTDFWATPCLKKLCVCFSLYNITKSECWDFQKTSWFVCVCVCVFV